MDAKVLSIEPLGPALHQEDLSKALAPEPKIDIDKARAQAAPQQIINWNNAPSSLKEWAWRGQLLQDITSDWISSDTRITVLIGFGGEGENRADIRVGLAWAYLAASDKMLQERKQAVPSR